MNIPFRTRAVARWMTFENKVFQSFLRAERRIRSLPTNVRLQPSEFDRRMFRLFFATVVSLLIVLVLPSRTLRIWALVGVAVLLFSVMAALALLDAFPNRRR